MRCTPARLAMAARSFARASFLVSSRKTSTTEAGSARSRASTAWKPNTTRGSRSPCLLTKGRSCRNEVDLARVEVDPHQLHLHPVGEAKALDGALAEQRVARGVVGEIVAPELR